MSGVIVRRKEGESPNSLIYRFSKKMQQSGILKEAKRRRFVKRNPSRAKVRASAMRRVRKTIEVEKLRKMGLL
ncbi:MAG: 30S ribosomal protein S21 [Candidatus Colwellbacteria bacterium]|nr:30S ribosomal protein S21 [Candidatus Colwellbacteria bacterium]